MIGKRFNPLEMVNTHTHIEHQAVGTRETYRLHDMKRFKQSRDVLKSHIGGDILNKFIENLPEYRHGTMAEQREMKTEAFRRWMAYMMIRNSDQAKYGSLLNGMVSQFLMNNNQYPVNI